jgi:hypothetical protein
MKWGEYSKRGRWNFGHSETIPKWSKGATSAKMHTSLTLFGVLSKEHKLSLHQYITKLNVWQLWRQNVPVSKIYIFTIICSLAFKPQFHLGEFLEECIFRPRLPNNDKKLLINYSVLLKTKQKEGKRCLIWDLRADFKYLTLSDQT